MISLLSSFFVIFLAEIADKTMLLTLSLSAKMRKFELIIGIFSASFAVMLLPILVGDWLNNVMPKASLVLASGLIFLAIGIFSLFEKSEEEERERLFKLPGFLTAFLVFLLAEMGDKTQIATFSMAVNSREVFPVWIGASLGLFVPNLAVVLLGSILMRINVKITKYVSSIIFISVGIIILLEYFGIIEF
ncbi:MAG: TMEM165/GDT1 family protein [Brevinematia bacterium]